MKLFEQKEVLPVDKQTFQKHVLFSLFVQFLFAILVYALMAVTELKTSDIGNLNILLGSILISNFIIAIFFMRLDLFQGRFKDAFPDHKITNAYLMLACMVPIFFAGLTIYLCIKNKSEDSVPSVFLFKFRYSLPMALLFIGLQAWSPKSAYWTAGPSTYFVIDTAYEAMGVVKFKESASHGSTALEDYQSGHGEKLSSTQLVLLTAVGASLIIKEKNREIASEKSKVEVKLKSGIKLSKMCHEILMKSESKKLEFLDFSPVQWLYPAGPIEIMLITMFETEILEKFNKVMIEKNEMVLKTMEAHLLELPKLKRKSYEIQIAELRLKFESTETFRAIASVKKLK